MTKRILVTVPKLRAAGGVSAFWNALLPEFEKIDDVHMTTLEIGGHGKNIFGPIEDQFRFKKISNDNFHLVVLNPSLGGKSFFRDAFFAKHLFKKNIPFVVFFHGWNIDFQHKIDKYFISFFQNTLGNAKTIFVLSNDFKQKLMQWGYKGTIELGTTTVDVRLFKNNIQEPTQLDENQVKVLFLSRLFKEKGLYETVNAFKKIIPKHPNAHLIIAGNGKEYEPLKETVKNNDNITLVGHVEGQEKIKLFKSCDIYCLPSYSEGLPTSVLEAMAFGKPVITTKVGGLKDFFKENEMGFFVKPMSVTDLEKKMQYLIENKDVRHTIGVYNNAFAHKYILSPKVAQKMANEFCKAAKIF